MNSEQWSDLGRGMAAAGVPITFIHAVLGMTDLTVFFSTWTIVGTLLFIQDVDGKSTEEEG